MVAVGSITIEVIMRQKIHIPYALQITSIFAHSEIFELIDKFATQHWFRDNKELNVCFKNYCVYFMRVQ